MSGGRVREDMEVVWVRMEEEEDRGRWRTTHCEDPEEMKKMNLFISSFLPKCFFPLNKQTWQEGTFCDSVCVFL